MSKIITHHEFPPIPIRAFDWCAYHESEVEQSEYYGWGPTEAEAIADLARLDQERAEEAEEKLAERYAYEHERDPDAEREARIDNAMWDRANGW